MLKRMPSAANANGSGIIPAQSTPKRIPHFVSAAIGKLSSQLGATLGPEHGNSEVLVGVAAGLFLNGGRTSSCPKRSARPDGSLAHPAKGAFGVGSWCRP